MDEINRRPLPPVDLRQLRALVAVDETRSFRASAARLGYAQSAVSHQIATLERALGVTLVHRPGGRHPVEPTPAGARAVELARQVIEGVERLVADMAALRGVDPGPLRLGVFQSAAAFLLPLGLQRFREEHPEVQLALHEEVDPTALLDMLRRGELDATFATNVAHDDPDIESIDLLEDRRVIVTWRGSAFAGRRRISLAMLDGVDMIAWQQGLGYHDAFERDLRRRGIEPRIVYRTNDNLTLQRGVAAGLGHACVGELAARGSVIRDLVIVQLSEALPPLRIQICWPRGRRMSAAANHLVESVRSSTGGPPNTSE